MSKSSFNEIEKAIKAAAEAHEPAFDEQAWKKMEALLDKEKDKKRPIAFWLWLLVPVLLVGGVVSYFGFKDTSINKPPQTVSAANENVPDNNARLMVTETNTQAGSDRINADGSQQSQQKETSNGPVNLKSNQSAASFSSKQTNENKVNAVNSNNHISNANTRIKIKPGTIEEESYSQLDIKEEKSDVLLTKKTANGKVKIKSKNSIGLTSKAKTATHIIPGTLEAGNETNDINTATTNPQKSPNDLTNKEKEEVVVIKVDAAKTSDKEIEKIIDSVAQKLKTDKKSKTKIARFYIVVTGGAEASGVKLFSASKITSRAGLGIGFNLNKNMSLQTGFYFGNKKYKATGSDYKTKAGTYWNIVHIKNIDANCRVYEIPVSLLYNFTPGKKVNIFASAFLSSYIMKKENYQLYYEHYGVPQQANVNYTGNQNLFSVLRLSAGIEKKVSKNFSIIASPGIAIPLAGVGDGEVKLFSTDIMIGIKFTPFRKK